MLRRFGHDVVVLDGRRCAPRSPRRPTAAAIWDRTGAGVLDPGKLAAGLRDAALRPGVRVFEHSAAHARRATACVITARGPRRARRVLLATSAYPPLLRSLRRYIAPVYDYALVTEPLELAQRAIGWQRRQGIGDAGNRFHYYRLTADNRILFGGYDAVYRYGGPVGPRHDEHDATFATLSQHFFHTFPQLEGMRFTHRWGGAIDTCSRFSGLLRDRARRPRRLRRRLHGARRRRRALRRPRRARPARRARDRGDAAAVRPRQARPVPTRAAALRRDPAHAQPARRRRSPRGPPRAVARTLDRLGLGFDS